VETETIAVIASSVVALAAIVVGWLDHGANRKQARELADLDNVRDVLDSAAELLHRTVYALDGIRLAPPSPAP
jgi:hypothetical protein